MTLFETKQNKFRGKAKICRLCSISSENGEHFHENQKRIFGRKYLERFVSVWQHVGCSLHDSVAQCAFVLQLERQFRC